MTRRFAWHATWGVVGVLMLALIALPFAGCGGSSSFTPPPADPDPDPDTGLPPNMNPDTAQEMLALWQTSGHADFLAEPFRHWDEDGEVPISCARCHSTGGFRDYIGADGSPIFSVDAPAPLGTTVNCNACHGAAADALDQVIFPSGAIATGLGAEARCMTCHQGRESTVSMNEHIAAAGIVDDDTPDSDLRFRNVHYFAAGATLYGGAAKGAYQYTLPGLDGVVGTIDDEPMYGLYDKRNPHVEAANVCIECHNPHSLERRISDLCANCHAGVTDDASLRNIRMRGSVRDYDADGNATEGIYYEILTMTQALYAAIQQYATNVLGQPIVYDAGRYPYFFNQTTGAGYSGWSARLLRAAYNYQYVQKDPGAFAHNPKYVIEFLYDSLKNLDEHPQVTVPNMAQMWRNDSGHFDAGAEAFRHWDSVDDGGEIDQGEVDTACARCHSPGGFDFWAEWGLDVTQPQQVGDGFRCEQCHVENADFKGTPEVKYIREVEFPSGVVVTNNASDPDLSFVCMSCHKGRESGVTVEADIQARLNDGNPNTHPRFRNIHYLAGGATLYGATAMVGYEYPAHMYAVKWNHFESQGNPGGNGPSSHCNFCHLADHTFLPQATAFCANCHGNIPLENFRINRATDYDGDGSNTEPLEDELQTFADRLLATLVDYAATVRGGVLTYDGDHYPYFGLSPASKWDEHIARATFNYQFWSKEPGAWAHNTHYMLELLYDSIEALQDAAANQAMPLGTNRLTTPTLLTRP